MRLINVIHRRGRVLLSILGLLIINHVSSNADPKAALSGEYEHGRKFTDVYVPAEEAATARDDEEFDEYTYNSAWLQLDQPVKKGVLVSIRTTELDRNYVSRPILNNSTRYGQIRVSLEPPGTNWAVWPHISIRSRDYKERPLDNQIFLAGVETRYRWGIRDNVRFGVSYSTTRYDNEIARSHEGGSAFASLEKPVSESLTFHINGHVDQNHFRIQSASRENASSAAAAVGFRYEF